ncbi:MAG: hypothetical protein M3R02_03820 [Chloroflexota bacterium]|nr:hypothetical protein [Chloroflexota bacterium]
MTTTTTAPAAVAPFLDDPAAFAHALYSELAAAGEPRLLEFAPVAYQAFMAALRAVKAAGPAPVEGETVERLDVAAHDWASACHAAGIEFGAAAEALRRSILASAAGPRLPWEPGRRLDGA